MPHAPTARGGLTDIVGARSRDFRDPLYDEWRHGDIFQWMLTTRSPDVSRGRSRGQVALADNFTLSAHTTG